MPVILTLFGSILILLFDILCHYRSKDMHSAIAVNWQCCNICIMQCTVSLLPVIWLCRGVVIPYTIICSINSFFCNSLFSEVFETLFSTDCKFLMLYSCLELGFFTVFWAFLNSSLT